MQNTANKGSSIKIKIKYNKYTFDNQDKPY